MKNTFVDISGKLNKGLVELYAEICSHAHELNIEILVVGATARDLVLVHGFDATIERGTRDIDFAINVGSWDDFEALRGRLLDSGFQANKKQQQKFEKQDSDGLPWEIDIVPFGELAESDEISWPPKHDFKMNVLRFPEALASALQIKISSDLAIVIPVASPAGICLLKLVAWLDRTIEKRAKDASDIEYLIETYPKIKEISDALYTDGYMEAHDYDETRASAMKLGLDTGAIASGAVKSFLQKELFDQEDKKELFANDMQGGRATTANGETMAILNIFIEAFTNT